MNQRRLQPTLSEGGRQFVLDLAVAVAVGAAVTTAIWVAEQPGSEPGVKPPDLVACLFGLSLGAVLLWRRCRPLAVLLSSVGLLLSYCFLECPGITPALPLAAALFSAAADRGLEAVRRVGEERLRIAREMHDVLGHTMTAISVQAGPGPRRCPDHPGGDPRRRGRATGRRGCGAGR